MSLRLQINLIIGILLATFASLLIGLHLRDTRQSVRDEMDGASVVATQLLSRVQANTSSASLEDMTRFLASVAFVRMKSSCSMMLVKRSTNHHHPPTKRAEMRPSGTAKSSNHWS